MHDNKLFKILRIVFLTLAIISLVFTLAKKVGLCADSQQISVPTEQPFVPMFQYSPLANNPEAQRNLTSDLYAFFGSSDFIVMFDNVNDPTSIKIYARTSGPFGIYAFSSWLGGNSQTINYVGTPYTGQINPDGTVNGALTMNPYGNGYYYDSAGNVNNIVITIGAVNPYIPVYSARTVYDVNDMGQEGVTACLTDGVLDEGSGDDVIDFDYIQALFDNTAEFSSDMGDLISDLPTDDGTTSIGQWFSNLFSLIGGGFSGLFSNIYRFFKPFFDNIFDFFDSITDIIVDFASDVADSFSTVVTTITSFFNSVKRVFDWFYEHGQDSDHQFDFMILFHYLFDFDTEAALDAFEENKYGDFILDVRDLFSTVYSSITGATASERVFFTISLGDHFGTHFQDITINFDWYANVRDTFLPYLMAFIYVSAIWLFIKRLPDIIHGAASAESSFTDALPEHAEVSHGLFTRGVSKNQPSLDKSPLSGGGGVHSGSSQFWY